MFARLIPNSAIDEFRIRLNFAHGLLVISDSVIGDSIIWSKNWSNFIVII